MGSGAAVPAVGTAHFSTSVPTFDVERTFSNGLYPVLALSKRYRGQFVRIRKVPEAVMPLPSPVTVTVWAPGAAVFGVLICLVNVPVSDVVALPTRVASKVMSTISEAP